MTFLVTQPVRSLPAMQETRVRSQGWEDPLEKERETHSSILARKSPGQRMELGRVGHNLETKQKQR